MKSEFDVESVAISCLKRIRAYNHRDRDDLIQVGRLAAWKCKLEHPDATPAFITQAMLWRMSNAFAKHIRVDRFEKFDECSEVEQEDLDQSFVESFSWITSYPAEKVRAVVKVFRNQKKLKRLLDSSDHVTYEVFKKLEEMQIA